MIHVYTFGIGLANALCYFVILLAIFLIADFKLRRR